MFQNIFLDNLRLFLSIELSDWIIRDSVLINHQLRRIRVIKLNNIWIWLQWSKLNRIGGELIPRMDLFYWSWLRYIFWYLIRRQNGHICLSISDQCIWLRIFEIKRIVSGLGWGFLTDWIVEWINQGLISRRIRHLHESKVFLCKLIPRQSNGRCATILHVGTVHEQCVPFRISSSQERNKESRGPLSAVRRSSDSLQPREWRLSLWELSESELEAPEISEADRDQSGGRRPLQPIIYDLWFINFIKINN